jgi:hypothetical protein
MASDIEERLASLREANAKRSDARRAKDLEAILPHIETLGPDNVALVEVAFISDELPVVCAVRAADKAEFKRYRAALERTPDGQVRDATVATDQLGRACTLYPSGETLSHLLEHKSILSGQLGMKALALSRGQAESEKKG